MMKNKLCWEVRAVIKIIILAVIVIGILLIMAFNDQTLAADFRCYDMPIIIDSPDEADILLLESAGFEINGFIAEGFYRIYDTADYVIDTGIIYLILPEYAYDCNGDGKVNLFDVTHWLNVVYGRY